MHIAISILFLVQALNVRAAIPSYVYDQATSYQNQDPPYPNIVITVWSSLDCGKTQGESVKTTLKMDANADNFQTNFLTQSYYLSRDLISDERLDWSACIEPGACDGAGTIKGQCMRFVQRTSPDSNGNSLLARTCYSLVPGATVSHLSREGLVDSVRTKIEYLPSVSISGTLGTALLTYQAAEQMEGESDVFSCGADYREEPDLSLNDAATRMGSLKPRIFFMWFRLS